MRTLPLLVALVLFGCRNKDTLEGDTGVIEDSGVPVAVDADRDGFTDDLDCDDTDPTVNPDAAEVCDGVDNDCDALVDDADPDVTDPGTWFSDTDADGYGDPGASVLACAAPEGTVAADTDCDDADGAVHPDAGEVCNGYDDDCDGLIDDDDPGVVPDTTWFLDADADGHGVASFTLAACLQPDGFAGTDDDCDDSDPTVFPDAPELCDGLDNDCDTLIDDAAEGSTLWYVDGDGDGYGDPASTVDSCDGSGDLSAEGTDCDDTDTAVNPGAPEICDGKDNDCSGDADGADALDVATWYADTDGDGHGDPGAGAVACDVPSGHVAGDEDCDDSDAAVNPDAAEVCNGVDDDCNGWSDDDDPGLTGASSWYLDADGDGYGGVALSVDACEQPSGYADNRGDCDDLDGAIHPDGVEVCDGADNDCDGAIDDDDGDVSGTSAWHGDSDGDGFGDPGFSVDACDAPSGTVSDDSDCDDGDAAVNPAAAETCSGVDDDCDGLTDGDDPDVSGTATWYDDSDGDGFGDPSASSDVCDAPSGTVSDATDCDDSDAAVNPDAAEVCNGADDDCDGRVDDDDPDVEGTDWYIDADGDGYGGSVYTLSRCEQPSGYVANADDCNDLTAGQSPDQPETCSGVDDDCDGLVDTDDPDLVDPILTWFADTDGDGFGDPGSTVDDCEAPSGTVADDTDCDDADGAVNPDAAETCNGIDDDCDGASDDGVAGTSETCAAVSCLDAITDDPSAVTGIYWLEPEAGVVLEALCDMDTDGGGWTLGFTKNSVDADTYEDFASGYEDVADLVVDPADASASGDAVGGWLDLNAFDYTALQLRAYSGGVETYASLDILRTDLRIDFGQDGYFLYGDTNGYYWCGGAASYTDSGSGQVDRPAGAPADCKGHGSVGSGWDFSTHSNTYNQGLTLCGNDASRWMHDSYYGTLVYYPSTGAAQAIWVR